VVGINFGTHPAAASPAFVADAPVANLERFGRTILCALLGKSAAGGHIAVLDPITHFIGSAAADIARQVRLGADQTAQTDEFVRTKTVVLNIAAPINVDPLGTRAYRADTVAPVIVVGEASARPTKDGDAQFTQVLDRLLAVSIDVRNRGFRTDPKTPVNAGSQVFGEMAVQFRTDRAYCDVGDDLGALSLG
jgi:hypothetical protein